MEPKIKGLKSIGVICVQGHRCKYFALLTGVMHLNQLSETPVYGCRLGQFKLTRHLDDLPIQFCKCKKLHHRKLYPCPNCKEPSVVRKLYVNRTEGTTRRVEFCINKGCGYQQDLPPISIAGEPIKMPETVATEPVGVSNGAL
jgi:hypothetical protein